MFTKVPSRDRSFFKSFETHSERFKRTPDGKDQSIELPQRYLDWSLMLAHFPASAAAVKGFLPEDSGLEPVTIAPGIGLVTLAAFDYRVPQTLKPYYEVGVMFPVRYRPLLSLPAVPLFRPEWFSDLGFYIWQLPVTTQEACDAGRAVWNFPKSVGQIEFTEADGWRRCTWHADKKHVLTLEVRMSRTTPQLRNFLAYSVLKDRLQQTLVQTFGEYDESRFGFDATFALGDHKIARDMRQLHIVATPIGRLYCPKAEGVLPGPSAVPFASVPALLQAPRALRAMVMRSIPKAAKPSTVAILGGGVAGLSAAHELAERRFGVTVYEQSKIFGGKARSFGAKDSAHGRRPPLPAEHGFRFFPGFYKHLPDTMARIPDGAGGTVADNLVAGTRLTVEVGGDGNLIFPARFPASLGDVGSLLKVAGLLQERTGCTAVEIAYYIERVWQLLTSCKERRLEEYEKKSWWNYIDAKGRSAAYQRLANTTRALVAADPKQSSTRTVGNVLLQLLFDFATPGVSVDRVLNGPTNEVWIDPWIEHLKTLGVEFTQGVVERIELKDGSVAGAVVDGKAVKADYYIGAVPVERMAEIIEKSPALVRADSRLKNVVELSQDVDTMAGIQFYFDEALPLEGGHLLHLDSEWALTSLAQAQFWKRDLADYGDGTIRDILSVDISDFHSVGNNGKGKPAEKSTREEIETEVWRQLQESMPFLKSMKYVRASLDPAIRDGKPNLEPLLVNKINRWDLRPQASTTIPNLFLASDYVQTNTDLATMEGANEAARRAVNAILEVSRSSAAPCAIWDLHEPLVLAPWRLVDGYRYRLGLPWNSDFPLALRGVEFGLTLVNSVVTTLGVGGAREVEPTPDTTVSAPVQKGVGDVLEAFITALKRGNRAALSRLFAPYALITVGLKQGPVNEFLPLLTRKVDVTVEDIPRLYQRGGRVHVVLAVGLSVQDGAPSHPPLAGHVHVVLVRRRGRRQAGGRGAGWAIASLRYRRAGAPARLETPRGSRSQKVQPRWTLA